jgi:dimethylamine monooxygenase subunit A
VPNDDPDVFEIGPFDGDPFRWTVGARPLDLDQWLQFDDEADAMLAEKARLLRDERDQVLGWLPPALAACEETLALVEAATGQPGPADEPHPLARAARLVQEDWAILTEGPGGGILAAACVCFPTRWQLPDKLGKPMTEVHVPVPRLADEIGRATSSMLERIRVDRPVWRMNWNLLDDGAWFQPIRRPLVAPLTISDIATAVHLRIERQTLRRLPETDAVLFGIRIHQRPLGAFVARPDVVARLAAAVRELPPDVASYKSITGLAPQVLDWIDTLST